MVRHIGDGTLHESFRCYFEQNILYLENYARAITGCVGTTIIDGRIVYEDRQFATVDEQDLLREADAAFRRVVPRMAVPVPSV